MVGSVHWKCYRNRPAQGGLMPLDRWLKDQDPTKGLTQKTRDAERVFRKTDVTFAVYGEREVLRAADSLRHRAAHRLNQEWRRRPEASPSNAMQALNAIDDIYHRQENPARRPVPGMIAAKRRRSTGMVGVGPQPASTPTSSASISCAPGENDF